VAIDIVMPALSPGMEKGHLARWLKAEGDAVKTGDVLAEIETDKATLELEAAADGVLSRILVPAWANDVPVNQPIAILGLIASPAKETASAAPEPTAPAPADSPAIDERGLDLPTAARAGAASPRARQLARNFGIDLSSVLGSGPQGRILERNIRDTVAAAMARPPVPPPAPIGPATETPCDGGMRPAIRPRPTQQPGRDALQLHLIKTWQVDGILDLRDRINGALPRDERGETIAPVTITDMLIKAWALTLHDVPEANLIWADDGPARLDRVDIAVTVPIPGGTATLVLRAAESKGIAAIACEIRDLMAQGRAGLLSRDDCLDASSIIADLGMSGIDSFAAGVSPPQVTTLAIGAIEKRLVVRGDAPAVAPMLSVTLSADRRAVDGALGARLMARFGELLATPLRLLA
jgi:pyruvate dehydrogenase E2 component (dihydrolipoamide acetyltransferase)